MYYAKPGSAETKRMHLIPRDFIQSSGWSGLLEDLCAPVDEVDTFNRLIRDPAGTGQPAAPPAALVSGARAARSRTRP